MITRLSKSNLLAGFGLVSCLLTLSGCASQSSAASAQHAKTAAPAQGDILDELSTGILRASPEWASQLAIDEAIAGEGYQSRLSNYGPQADKAQREYTATWLQRLLAVDATTLSQADQQTLTVVVHALKLAVRRNQFPHGAASTLGASPPYAVNQIFSPQLDLPRLLSSQLKLRNADDVNAFLARLQQLGPAITQLTELVERDVALDAQPPRFILQSIADASRSFITGRAADNAIAAHLLNELDNVDAIDAQKARWHAQAVSIIEASVYPAYIDFAERLEALMPTASQEPGIWRLPNGEAMYQMYLDNYGANGMSADEVHNLGLAEVERIEAEMDDILDAYGLTTGSAGDRVRQLAMQPEHLADNTDAGREQILSALASYETMIRDKALTWFTSLPDAPLAIQRIPIFAEASSGGAYYSPPWPDGSRPGTFWINLKDTGDWPLFYLKSLFFHEAVPGHHFQALLNSSDDQRLLNSMMFFSEHSEGWALYAEALAFEMGAYAGDPLGNLGRLRMELYRAARLVVDTGIHSRRWSRSHAIQWMQHTTGDTKDSVTREIDRYATWPGQATSYKLGMIAITQMRLAAQAALGDNFNIGAFHDVILSGGMMPIPVLEAKVERWLEAQLNNA
ncbi:MAG: DUF885 domain-containing protein [Pseudomonadaceae bacterium]|nr:DUF885 domain-containing protein [Pseudomonadaceae bacterium]